MDKFDCPSSVDTNTNPWQQIVDECDVYGDVTVCSVDTDSFTGINDQGIIDGVNDVHEYIVLDAFSCDDINVNTEGSVDEIGVHRDVDICFDGRADDNNNVKSEINLTEIISKVM